MSTNLRVPIRENTDVAEARRSAAALGRSIALSEDASGRLAIVVTEAASNVLKHGGGGAVLLAAREEDGDSFVEVLALDQGGGIHDLARSLEDGYSTAGTFGNGLGAIKRLSTFQEVYTFPGRGTVLLARISNRSSDSRPPLTEDVHFVSGAVCVPREGETVCGDAWSAHSRDSGIRVLLADGLGHGIHAAEASNAAIALGASHPEEASVPCLERIHAGLRATRGAAVSVAEVRTIEGAVFYAGLGNVSGTVLDNNGGRRQMVSHNGTAGHQARKIQLFTYPWAPDSTLILHSDGIGTHWSLDTYPGLLRSHPALIAAVLYRDFQRGRDDATVVVSRYTSNGPGRAS